MIRKCDDCGKTWPDYGNDLCPFCSSENTYLITDSLHSPVQEPGESYAEGEI
jgi:rRNA maturation endonuclease Nob1